MEQNLLQTMNFDSSISDIDKCLSPLEYKDKLIEFIKNILSQRFQGIPTKLRILPYKDRLTFACPYCGDSTKELHKKRGNLILEGKFKNTYKCFNCGEFKKINYFLKDWKINPELDFVNYISLNQTENLLSTNHKYDASLLLDVEYIEKFALPREYFKQKFGLIEAKDSKIWKWLNKRLHYDSSKFLYSIKNNYLVILNLTPSGNILGFQTRKFTNDKNKYRTYKLSKIYELLALDKSLVTDEIDTVSTIFGIFQINFSKSVTLFEGPLDSFLLPNSCANCGANKQFPLDINIRYFFDFDKTGKTRSIEKLEQNQYVFLWSKFIRDYKLPYREKWDINDLLIYLKDNNIKKPIFNNYFSNDPYDIIDI